MNISERIFQAALVLFVGALVIGMTFVGSLVWVSDSPVAYRYRRGDIVRMKLDGQRGSVEWVSDQACIAPYQIRLPLSQGGYVSVWATEQEVTHP